MKYDSTGMFHWTPGISLSKKGLACTLPFIGSLGGHVGYASDFYPSGLGLPPTVVTYPKK